MGRTGISESVTPAQFKALVSDPQQIVIPGQEKTGDNLLRNLRFNGKHHNITAGDCQIVVVKCLHAQLCQFLSLRFNRIGNTDVLSLYATVE